MRVDRQPSRLRYLANTYIHFPRLMTTNSASSPLTPTRGFYSKEMVVGITPSEFPGQYDVMEVTRSN